MENDYFIHIYILFHWVHFRHLLCAQNTLFRSSDLSLRYEVSHTHMRMSLYVQQYVNRNVYGHKD